MTETKTLYKQNCTTCLNPSNFCWQDL